VRKLIQIFVSPEFWSDKRGVTWIYVTITASALFGFAGLVIDFARVEITHTQARSAAEAVALAGASQLDGTSDAITRALNAALNTPLVQNDQNLGATPGNITITNIRFLSGLPAGDPTLPENPSVLDPYVVADQNWTAASAPDAPFEARFIEVTTQQITVNNSFIQVVGGGQTAVTSASAVAGFTQVLCRRAPLAICNPVEDPSQPFGTPAPPFDIAQWKGRQILIKGSGPSSSWVPGDFALVDIDGVQSTPAIWEALAAAEPDVCIQARVNLKPGQVEGARTALNTRFGMYENPFGDTGGRKNDPRFRPARNMTKGKVLSDPLDMCSIVDPSPALPDPAAPISMPLPRDDRAADYNGALNAVGTGPTNTHRFGNGSWNCRGYWNTMHPGAFKVSDFSISVADVITGAATATNALCGDESTTTASRFDLYRHEINSGAIPNTTGEPTGGENGNPMNGTCYGGPTTAINDIPDRRIVYFAVINCVELGPLTGNSAGDLPVEAFVRGFLTEPVSDPSGGPEILLEIVDIARPGGQDGVLHDIVQLYR
jgi:Flp pilus assembly protein TadG